MFPNTFRTYSTVALLIVLLLMSGLTFSSCKKKCQEGSSAYPECLPEEDVDASTKNLKEDITLTFWNLYDDEKIFRPAIQTFQSKPRENVRVKVEYKTFINEEKYEEHLLDKMAEGGGPDIFAMHYSWLPRHQKKITPVPPEIMTTEGFREVFSHVATDTLIRTNEEGLEDIYGLPLSLDTLALFYNKKIFSLLTKKKKPAETWEEMRVQVDNELVDEDSNSPEQFTRTGIALGRSDNITYAIDILSLLFLQNGVQFFDEDGKVTLNEATSTTGTKKAAITALDLFKGFEVGSQARQENWNKFITGLYPQEKDYGAFARGKVAMVLGYSNALAQLRELAKEHKKKEKSAINPLDIAVAPLPQMISRDKMSEKDFPITLANFYALTVSRNSPQSDLAWELLYDLSTNIDNVRHYSDETKRPTALVNEELLDEQKAQKHYGIFAQQIQYAHTVPFLKKKVFSDIFAAAIDRQQRKGSAAVLQVAEKRLRCLMDQIQQERDSFNKNCAEI